MADLTEEQARRLTTLAQVATLLDTSLVEDLIAVSDWVLYGHDFGALLRRAVDGDEAAREEVRRLAGVEGDETFPSEQTFPHEDADTVTMQAVRHG